MIRAATLEDVEDLVTLSEEFTNESDWNWTWNEENARNTLQTVIPLYQLTGKVIILMDDQCRAAAQCETENSWTTETIGYISKFYVKPEFRKTRVGVELFYGCMDFTKNCTAVFASNTASIKDNAYKNMLLKRGFEDCGTVLRRINHG